VLGNPSQWYNPSCFAVPTVGTLGSTGRDAVRGPSLVNLDFAALKNTKINEKINAQFRAEFFNLANHPNFGIPSPN